MRERLRLALVAPVAQPVPPPRSGSVETITASLADGLVARGHDVTLFATGGSTTRARLHAVYPKGYLEDPGLWPWEMCELFNLSTAVAHAADFDLIHYHAVAAPCRCRSRRCVRSRWSDGAPPAAGLRGGAVGGAMPGLAVHCRVDRAGAGVGALRVAGIVPHAVDVGDDAFRADPDDYLLFLGRFTEGKGVLEAVEIARRSGHRLLLAAKERLLPPDGGPLVDGARVRYVGEVDQQAKVALLGGARAGLPGQGRRVVRARAGRGRRLRHARRGAPPRRRREIVEDGVTGVICDTIDGMVAALPRALALDRGTVRARAVARFGVDRMVDRCAALYAAIVAESRQAPR